MISKSRSAAKPPSWLRLPAADPRTPERALSGYVHIPFCERKCIYCDFYSIENRASQSAFVDALITEIERKSERDALKGSTLSTLFFGGGTPSLLTPQELERILSALQASYSFADDIEFTLECNPGTVTLESLRAYRQLGANRLSFGVQSFVQRELDFLGRIHTAAEAEMAVALARQAGFDNLSIDLIFALPDQTMVNWQYSLERAIALGTEHISAYNLIVEPGTPLFRLVQHHKVIELDPDRSSELYGYTQSRLAEAGFVQYEISNYAQSSDLRCRHNLAYWDGEQEYVSFGPSAHEFLSGERRWNISSLDQYLQMIASGGLPLLNSERLTRAERRTEFLYLQLRATGLSLERFERIFGEPLLANDSVKFWLEQGKLLHDGDLLSLAPEGYLFCDGIVRDLIEEEVPASFSLAVV